MAGRQEKLVRCDKVCGRLLTGSSNQVRAAVH